MAISLVIDKNVIEHRTKEGNFFEADFSMAWVNTISRQMGSCQVFSTDDNPEEVFKDATVVVFSSSVEDSPENFHEAARDFVSKGGVLVLEMPDPDWVETFNQQLEGIEGKAEMIRAKSGFSTFNFRILCSPYPETLAKMPVCTRAYSLNDTPRGMESLLHLNGAPAILQYKFQQGWVISIMFDMAMQLTAIHQGAPNVGDYTVKELRGKVPFIKEPDDLVIDDKMMENDLPFADILENFLFAALEDLVFLPRLWYYPIEYNGAFLMSHDEEKKGQDACRYMMEEEKVRGFVSTFFIITSSDVGKTWKNVNEFLKKGFDVQWHWNRFPDLFKVTPPHQQVYNFKKLDDCNLTTCRIHFLDWGDHYNKPFAQMEKLGIRADTTLGPNKGRGYTFGTGWPFRPINSDGSLFNLYEIPFISQEDWYGADEEFLKDIFFRSNGEFHSTIGCIFHPTKGANKAGKVRDLWLGAFAHAKEWNHWITTYSEFINFLDKRSKVRIISPLDGKTEQIRMENPFPGIGVRTVVHPMDKTGVTGEFPAVPIPKGDFRVVMETGRKYKLFAL